MHPEHPTAPCGAERLAPGDLVDEREAAAILRVAVQTMRNWRWRGEGPPARKLGKRCVRYFVADLAAFASIVDGPAAESAPASPSRAHSDKEPAKLSAEAIARLRAFRQQDQRVGDQP